MFLYLVGIYDMYEAVNFFYDVTSSSTELLKIWGKSVTIDAYCVPNHLEGKHIFLIIWKKYVRLINLTSVSLVWKGFQALVRYTSTSTEIVKEIMLRNLHITTLIPAINEKLKTYYWK